MGRRRQKTSQNISVVIVSSLYRPNAPQLKNFAHQRITARGRRRKRVGSTDTTRCTKIRMISTTTCSRTVYGKTSPQQVRRNENTIISVVFVSTIVFSGWLRQDAAQPPEANAPAPGVHALPLSANDAINVPPTNNSQALSHGCEQATYLPIERSSLHTRAVQCRTEDPRISTVSLQKLAKKISSLVHSPPRSFP